MSDTQRRYLCTCGHSWDEHVNPFYSFESFNPDNHCGVEGCQCSNFCLAFTPSKIHMVTNTEELPILGVDRKRWRDQITGCRCGHTKFGHDENGVCQTPNCGCKEFVYATVENTAEQAAVGTLPEITVRMTQSLFHHSDHRMRIGEFAAATAIALTDILSSIAKQDDPLVMRQLWNRAQVHLMCIDAELVKLERKNS